MNEAKLNNIRALARQYKIVRLIQFGSSLDSPDDCNDFDFLYDGQYDRTFLRFGYELEKLLSKPVDLIPMEPEGPFIDYVKRHGKVVYDSTIS